MTIESTEERIDRGIISGELSYRCLGFDTSRNDWDCWLAGACHGASFQVAAHLKSYVPYRARVSLHVLQDGEGKILAGAGILSWHLPGRIWFGEGNGAPVGEQNWWPVLLRHISDWARRRGCMCLGFSPHVPRTDAQAIEALTSAGFKPGRALAPLEHLGADLRISLVGQSNEALLASFRRQTRQNILHSLEAGLKIVSPTGAEDVARVARFLHITASENGVSLRPLDNFVSTISDIVRSGAGYAALVKYQGEPMACGVFARAGQAHRCYQLATKRTRQDLKTAYFLHWNAIQNARDAGARWYYFTGRSVPSVYQFKRGFRPEEFDLTAHHRSVFRPVLTTMFEKFRPMMVQAVRAMIKVRQQTHPRRDFVCIC